MPEVEMPSVRVYAPCQTETITVQVRQTILQIEGRIPHEFKPYYDALCRVWSQLSKDQQATRQLALEIYIQIAEEEGFMIEPEHFKRAA